MCGDEWINTAQLTPVCSALLMSCQCLLLALSRKCVDVNGDKPSEQQTKQTFLFFLFFGLLFTAIAEEESVGRNMKHWDFS